MFSFQGRKIWESREAIENLLTWDNIDSSACDKLFSRNLFEELMVAARVCSLGQISHALYQVGGQYRRSL